MILVDGHITNQLAGNSFAVRIKQRLAPSAVSY
jgi:hypothetical protein